MRRVRIPLPQRHFATVIDHDAIAVRAGTDCAMPMTDRFGVPATCRVFFALTRAEKSMRWRRHRSRPSSAGEQAARTQAQRQSKPMARLVSVTRSCPRGARESASAGYREFRRGRASSQWNKTSFTAEANRAA
ncbi:aminotransferase class V-fold PLP-dependent enzyme [Bradyrhizobium jicamae]|uniref:aminotransferase class V-fold PLP-dependent enzyme n=1 Tax=Bradyrhizobium jicamae TaxID=280332 RepID=UPI003D31DAC2